MIVSDILVGLLEDADAKFVFGVPGSTVVSLISSISESETLRFISSLNENASLGMADGYARASGRFGVALLHTTPGLTTAMPNLYNAFVDGIPLLLLVGDVNSRSLITEPALALNGLIDVLKPLSKWCYYAKSASDAIIGTERALKILFSTDPGPCGLIIPEDIMEQEFEKPGKPFRIEKMLVYPNLEEIQKIVSMIDRAKWPVLLVGREIRDEEAVDALARFSALLSVPVLVESPYPSAYCVSFAQNHPSYLGLFSREAEALRNADLIVALGGQLITERKFYEKRPFSSTSKIVHMHSNPRELGKNLRTDIQLLATPGLAAIMMMKLAAGIRGDPKQRDARARRIRELRSKMVSQSASLLSRRGDRNGIKPWELIERMKRALKNSDFVVVDEGVVTSSYLSHLFEFNKTGSLIGRGAGCLGWGVSAAVGAKLAHPEKKVIAFVGDGALLFGPQALWTAAHYKIPIAVIVCNNAGYASVTLSFDSYKRRSKRNSEAKGCKITKPELNILKLSQSLGAECVSVNEADELESALNRALSSKGVQVIDARIDPKEKGYELSLGMKSKWT